MWGAIGTKWSIGRGKEMKAARYTTSQAQSGSRSFARAIARRFIRRPVLSLSAPSSDGFAQQVLDLGVYAAELVLGPAFEIVQEVSRQANEEWLSLSHETVSVSVAMVNPFNDNRCYRRPNELRCIGFPR